jgi:hypothetical protein
MQQFILVIFWCVTFCEFMVQWLGLPSMLRFLPEICSCLIVVYVLVAGTRDRFQLVAPKYWLVFGALTIEILCGVITNNPGAGPLISGLRFDFRAAPLFFLPAVLGLSEEQLKRQLKVLLVVGLIQLPVAVYQRWNILSEGRFSGDGVVGTLLDSGVLSMFLICSALVLTGVLLKRRIGRLSYGLLFLLLLFPTTINETKATVIFLPVGLLATLVLGADPGKRLRHAGIALSLLVVFGAIFVPVYDKMEEGSPYKIDIVDFFTSQRQLSHYLGAKYADTGIGGTKPARRGEAIKVSFEYLAKDPVSLAFGLGLGNASPSNLGKNFEGSYYVLFQSVLTLSFSFFLLEFGILGVLLIAALFWMVFSDSLAVARHDDTLTGALAAGWIGVVGVFVLATFYTAFQYFTSVTYLYWYFSGVVCARAMALRLQTARVPHRAVQPQWSPAG